MGIGPQPDAARSRTPKRSKAFSAVVRSYQISVGALALAAGGSAIALYQAIHANRLLPALIIGISTMMLVLAPTAIRKVVEWRPPRELLEEIGVQNLGSLDSTSKVLRSPVDPELLSGWHEIIADDKDYRSVVASIELALANTTATSIFVADIGAEPHRENFTKSLASTYSTIGYRTVAIDLGFNPSFESSSLSDESDQTPGFYQVITRQSSVREALTRSGEDGNSLLYLPSGGPTPAASRPHLSPRLAETLKYLGDNSDRVIMSGGSAIGPGEELVPACFADCAVILARRSASSEAILREAVRNLTKTGTPIIGICFIEEPPLPSLSRTTPAPTTADDADADTTNTMADDIGTGDTANQLSATDYLEQIEAEQPIADDDIETDLDDIETDLDDSETDLDDSDVEVEEQTETAADYSGAQGENPQDHHPIDDYSGETGDLSQVDGTDEVVLDLTDEPEDPSLDMNVFDNPSPDQPDQTLEPVDSEDEPRGILSENDNAHRYSPQSGAPLRERLQFWKKNDQSFPTRPKTAESKPEPIAKPLGVPVEESNGSLFGTRVDQDYDPLLTETVEIDFIFDGNIFDSRDGVDESAVEADTLEQSET